MDFESPILYVLYLDKIKFHEFPRPGKGNLKFHDFSRISMTVGTLDTVNHPAILLTHAKYGEMLFIDGAITYTLYYVKNRFT